MTSRQTLLSRGVSLRRAAASVMVAATLGLGACSIVPNNGPVVEPAPVATSSAAAADAQPAPQQTAPALTAAQELGKKLEGSLAALAQTSKAPNRAQMLDAMLTAGAVKEKTEVSIDITPTGLAVDAIEAATLVAEECVVGQVREGNAKVTILPVLASGRCFVGEVNPLP